MIILIMGLALLLLTLLFSSQALKGGMTHFQMIQNISRKFGMIRFNIYVHMILATVAYISMFVVSILFIYIGGMRVLSSLFFS